MWLGLVTWLPVPVPPPLPPLPPFEDDEDEEDDEDDDDVDEVDDVLSKALEARLRSTRLIDDTLGMLSWLQTSSLSSRSRISQANIDGHSRLYAAILCTTSEVATRGLLPPMARGFMLPVS